MATRVSRSFVGPKVFAPMDRWLLRHSKRRRGLTVGPGSASILLTTTGHRTGEPRRVALLAQQAGDDLVVVASNWGRAAHPSWSTNLLTDPHAHVNGTNGDYDVVARLCDSDETARRWPGLVRTMPLWDGYRDTADRDLRVFVLRRAS